MVFTLKIELGNDAMQTGEDVALALEQVALNLTRRIGSLNLERDKREHNVPGLIKDANGNTVGKWECV